MVTKTREAPAQLLLSVRDAAKALAISERTLFSLTQCGQIRAVRVGRRGVRYSTDELARWIKAQETTPTCRDAE